MPGARERHQHLDRMQVELSDQHGRVWLGVTELGRDFYNRPRIVPVGSFQPQFTTPYDFLPDQKYLVFDGRRPSDLTINYRAWVADQRARHRDVQDYLAQLAWAIYKDQAPQYIKEPTPEMLEIVYGKGKGPEPYEPIIAAMQGNGWILGLREFDARLPGDARLKPFMERWVTVRYRDVRPFEDEMLAAEALDFTEGQPEDDDAALVPDLGDEEEE